VPDLRIVDQDSWDAVQHRLGSIRNSPRVEKARARRFWEKRRAKHLLTGLTRCGACGSPLAAVGKDYLACGAGHRQGTCESRRGIPRSASGAGMRIPAITTGCSSRWRPVIPADRDQRFRASATRVREASVGTGLGAAGVI